MLLADKLKDLREEAKQPQRRVAAALDIDTATYCKMEKGKYIPNREQVLLLSSFFNIEQEEMIKLWLADKLIDVAKDEDMAQDAFKIANEILTH
ncbi:MAG: helix-turn-helix domain-containing protein [Bacteroidaceae bacterium]|nr:helix-turn-helix domain-containing protein [Bacteroidaceae bacterium]